MKTSQKGSTQVIVIAVVVIAILVGLYFYFANNTGNNTGYQSQSNTYGQPTATTAPAIQSDQDLTLTSQNLDTTDVNQLNSGLSQNDADAQAF